MKDLIEQWVSYLPVYLSQLGALLSGPKTFIAREVPDGNSSLEQPLRFLTISLALHTVVLFYTQQKSYDLWHLAATAGIMGLLTVSLVSAILYVSWRIVGGKPNIRQFFCVYSYFAGTITVMITLLNVMADGFLKSVDAEAYARAAAAAMNEGPPVNFLETITLQASIAIYVLGHIFVWIWTIIGWGALRRINRVDRWRSLLAYLLAGLFSLPASAIIHFVVVGLL